MIEALGTLEGRMGQKLGDVDNPLLVSVRSGAKFSMPGMMDTILNLGLERSDRRALEAKSGNPRFAYDCYRRFIQMFGKVVLDIDMAQVRPSLRRAQEEGQGEAGYRPESGRPESHNRRLQKARREEDRQAVPAGCRASSLAGAVEAVFRSWWDNQRATIIARWKRSPDDLGTAANVQAMVFGNMGETSATGVGFTRDPATGEKVFYGEFLINAQGEDVVAGIRTPHPIAELEDWIMPRSTTSFAKSPATSKSTTATCRTSSSPFRRASSTCCRPATASAPVRRRCASRSKWWRKA